MVLVIGATGILGRTIVLELLKQGKAVRAAKRLHSDTEDVRKTFMQYDKNGEKFFSNIEWVDVNFDDLDSLRKAMDGVEEVYHCAAIVSFNPKNKKNMYHTNINGTKNILYISSEKNVKKFLFVSSIAVLDGANEKGFLDENSNYNSKLLHPYYTVSKHFSEMEVWRAGAEGMNVCIINPGIIIGSGNWGKSSGTMFSTLMKIKYTTQGVIGYVDVRDVAKIATELMNKNIFGERFILISENKSYQEVSDFVRGKMNLKKAAVVSSSVLRAVGKLASLVSWAIPLLRAVNLANINALITDGKVSNEKIKNLLDYDFIPVEESLEYHLNHYLNHKEKLNEH
ncbi:NAD-dependent epimerase/dehydratase family protein [Riemerella columbipharyngis]|uniref:Nucleoside-diphosphate-sugar epimerase n=1 Tax=Riemerella columbipharyngis TaxID=1071918 RepID=A0A1G6ZQ36_9FLAO|nr:NAD-dependent epimerase/dehydratase family protein [Riemerella columbipharyngis]SDE03965.1 Nucleoside-diphosphate-sugar epimerase [Riemerella columbipharyngis]